jgi:hypothetical protein
MDVWLIVVIVAVIVIALVVIALRAIQRRKRGRLIITSSGRAGRPGGEP